MTDLTNEEMESRIAEAYRSAPKLLRAQVYRSRATMLTSRATQAVERLGASPELTAVVVLLAQVRSAINDDLDERDRLAARVAELEGQEQRADLHANLNRRCADALGLNRPEADVWPSWHDMPERIAALMARVAELGALRKSAHELVGAIQAHECESFDCDRTDERYCDCLKNATDAMASVLARCDGMAKEEG